MVLHGMNVNRYRREERMMISDMCTSG